MKIAAFILIAYLAVVAAFAGIIAAVAVLVALILIVAIEFMFGLDRPYFDSEDIGREVKPYVKRIQYTELIIAGLFLAVVIGLILIFKGI